MQDTTEYKGFLPLTNATLHNRQVVSGFYIMNKREIKQKDYLSIKVICNSKCDALSSNGLCNCEDYSCKGAVALILTDKLGNTKYVVVENKANESEFEKYFNNIYGLYPRKVNRVQAQKTLYKKLAKLDKEQAHLKAVKIYKMLERQIAVWQNENNGEGRKQEHIPYCSSWLNANVED